MMIKLANLSHSNLMIDNSVPIFNISNPNEPVTIFDLAKLIAEYFNATSKKGAYELECLLYF